MTEEIRPPGQTTIAPEVLLTIVNLTTRGITGVNRMSAKPGAINRLLRRDQQNNGVRIEITGNQVDTDIYVVIDENFNIREVSESIQKKVGRAIAEMVGMQIGEINIHVEDIDFYEDKTP